MNYFFVTQDGTKRYTDGYFYSDPKRMDSEAIINEAIKAAGEVATDDNPTTVVLDGRLFYISGHVWFTPNGNPARGSVADRAPAYPCDNVILLGIKGATIKLAPGLDLDRYGPDNGNPANRVGMIYMYGARNITLERLCIDGSYDDLYDGKKYKYGQGRGDMVSIVHNCNNIAARDLFMTNGACDAFNINNSSDLSFEDCVINWSGHDGWNCYNARNVTVRRCRVGIRGNCGFRWAGSSNNAEVCDSEFWTAKGGAAAFEPQNAASNIEIHHNYIHHVNGNGYGAIGYKGQSPSGSGHKYYNNLIVECAYGISDNIPATAIIRDNVFVNASVTSRGFQSSNLFDVSGRRVEKTGTDKKGNVHWIVDGKLYGIRARYIEPVLPTPEPPTIDPDVPIDPIVPDVDPGTGELVFTLNMEVTVNPDGSMTVSIPKSTVAAIRQLPHC